MDFVFIDLSLYVRVADMDEGPGNSRRRALSGTIFSASKKEIGSFQFLCVSLSLQIVSMTWHWVERSTGQENPVLDNNLTQYNPISALIFVK